MDDTTATDPIIQTYQTRPKYVDAVFLPPELSHETYLALMEWLPVDQVIFYVSVNQGGHDRYSLHIEQPNLGKIVCHPGQWVVKEDGQYFRMLDDGFRRQYEVSAVEWE